MTSSSPWSSEIKMLASRFWRARYAISLNAAVATVLIALCTHLASANTSGATPAGYNGDFPSPPGSGSNGPTNLELTIQNTVVIPNQKLGIPTDPFCPPDCTLTVMQGSGTETLTYSGSALLPSSNYHFGTLYEPGNTTLAPAFPVVSVNWSFPGTMLSAVPVAGMALRGVLGKRASQSYAVVFFEASFDSKGSSPTASWYLFPYEPKGKTQPRFDFTNYGSQTLYLFEFCNRHRNSGSTIQVLPAKSSL